MFVRPTRHGVAWDALKKQLRDKPDYVKQKRGARGSIKDDLFHDFGASRYFF